MVDAKLLGRQAVEAPTAQQLAPVSGIIEALKASFALGKKPVRSVASEQPAATVPEPAPAAKGKRGRKRSGGAEIICEIWKGLLYWHR